jgi:hypothetical protein
VLRAPKSDEPLQLRQLGAHASMRPRTVVLDEDLLFTKKFKPRPVHLRCIMFLCAATWCSVQAMAAATAQRHTVRQTTTDAQRRRIAPRSTAAHWLVLSGDGGAAARLQADTDAQRPDAGLSSVRPHRRAARALAYQPLNAAFAELSRAEPSRHVMRCERLPHDAMLSVWIAPCV